MPLVIFDCTALTGNTVTIGNTVPIGLAMVVKGNTVVEALALVAMGTTVTVVVGDGGREANVAVRVLRALDERHENSRNRDAGPVHCVAVRELTLTDLSLLTDPAHLTALSDESRRPDVSDVQPTRLVVQTIRGARHLK